MANMIPNLSESDPMYKFNKNSGEKTMYFLLKKLPNTWTVHYSVILPKSEADFIVSHPKYGLMIIEVKGGEIEYSDNCWQSGPANGQKNTIHPITQLNICKRTLRDSFAERFGKGSVPLFSTLCFPQADKIQGESVSFADILIMMRSEINFCLEKTLLGEYEYQWNEQYKRTGQTYNYDEKLYREVNSYISGSNMKLSRTLKNRIEDNKELMHMMSNEQMEIFQMLEDHQKILVNGVAGSGKTVLAMKIAHQKAEEGKKVLFTCKNKMLGEELKNYAKNQQNLTVAHYDSFVTFHLHKFPEFKDRAGKFELFPETLMEMSDYLDKYDVIIIDEAQDFSDDMKQSLEFIHKEGDKGEWYAFQDIDQNVTNFGHRPIGWDNEFVRIRLRKNMRNPEDVANIANYFKSGEGEHPKSSPVLFLAPTPREHLRTKVSNMVSNLIDTQKIDPNNIIILHDGKDDIESRYGVQVTTIRKFKGLERPVVILAHIDSVPGYSDSKSLMYVGATRATSALYVIASEETFGHFKIQTVALKKTA
jgi:superfamily I DNA/RNA helicase